MPVLVTRFVPAVGTDPRESFVALLPVLEARARSAFRRVRRYHDREDAVAEVVAHAWSRYRTGPVGPDELAAGAVAEVRRRMARSDA